ncbi:MAG: hypothetical protein KF891_11430 [Rhizobacter sp.]|nr:hypothetical protein [Rhizobacter sp.]
MSFVNYSPVVHWPLSGSVAQDIHPSLLARSGSDETELRVLREVASYGRQIGVLSDLLLALVDAPQSIADAESEGGHALRQLRELVADIRRVKEGASPLPDNAHAARQLIQALKQRFPELRRD